MKALALVFGGLIVWGAVTGKAGESGGPPTAATEIPTSGGHGALFGVLVVVGLIALVVKAGSGGGRPVVHSRGNHSRRHVVGHERAHVRALRRSGAGGGAYRVRRERDGTWSGVTTGRSAAKWAALPPEKKIGVLDAGRHGGPGTGHAHDDAGVAAVLAAVPSRDRGRVLRKGQALGRRWGR